MKTTADHKVKCLNCNKLYEESYNFCPNCGQKNKKVQLGLKFLINDFLAGSFNIDSRFWVSIRLLITSPGLLSREFLKGRHVGFLSPLRLYLLMSLFYFSLLSLGDSPFKTQENNDDWNTTENQNQKVVFDDDEVADFDTDTLKQFLNRTFEESNIKQDSSTRALINGFTNEITNDTIEDDSDIEQVAGVKMSKLKSLKSKEGKARFMMFFSKYFSPAMFFIMPFAAFFLYLIFGRRRKGYYFESLVFMLHLQALAFFILGVFTLLQYFFPYKWVENTANLFIITAVYAWLKDFYKFTWFKAVLASLIFLFSYFTILGLGLGAAGYIALLMM